jgi:hypothetical protein
MELRLSVGRTKSLIIDICPEELEALTRLGDFVPHMCRKDFIEKVCSLLLVSILVKSRNEIIDAFERLMVLTSISNVGDSNKLWGEFLQLLNYFRDLHYHDDGLRDELNKLPRGDMRVHPEERFQIKFAKRGSYLMVT